MKKLTKITTLVLALVMLLSLGACGGSTVGTVEDGLLIMSTNATFPPWIMTDDTGEVVGIDAEIAAAIAEKLGLELEIDDMDFDAALMAVQQGKSDIGMGGFSVTPARELVMAFTDTYATGIQSVIVPEGSDIASIDDLTGKSIGAQRGTTGHMYTEDQFGADNVTAYDSGTTAVQALVNDQLDCVVIDNEPAKAYVAANPGLVILDTDYALEYYAACLNKDNTELFDAVNTALAELIADGTVQSIIDKYITAD